jgi:hypothetical protein
VGFATICVALHRSARSRGYKLSREGAGPKSLEWWWWFDSGCYSIRFCPPCSSPCPPFIASKGRAWVTFAVKGVKTGKRKEKGKKGGLGSGRPSSYPVGTVSLQCEVVRGVDLLASAFTGASCQGHALTCMSLCHEGGRCMRRDFCGEGVRWHNCHHPNCCGGMDVIVVE